MKPWYENIPRIWSYNPTKNILPYNVELSGDLSPLTNFFLNVFLNSFGKRNLIIAFPDNILKPIPIVSYLYAYLKKRDVVVFTQKGEGGVRNNPVEIHNRNYHLLNYGGEYIFYHIPLGIASDTGVEAKVYLPRAARGSKQKYVQQQKTNFLDGSNQRILLHYDDRKIADNIEGIVLDEEEFSNLKVKFDPGLIIFEHVDRFVNSRYSAQLFLKWISPLFEDKRLIFHFSNPESRFIQVIKRETDSLAIPFGHVMLKSNAQIRKASLEYFKKGRNDIEWRILNNYNIDRTGLYKGVTPIEVIDPPLKMGNIDYHLKTAKYLLMRIDEEKILNTRLYYTVSSLLFKLPNLTINPSKYKVRYGDNSVKWRYYTIPQLLQISEERLLEEDEEIRWMLKELNSEVYNIYLELKECKRYDEVKTYSRIGKDYKILDMLYKMIRENHNQIKIATYSPIERGLLEEEITRLELENHFEVRTINQINKSTFDRSKSTLILPGPLRMKHLSELLLPYKRIFILSYEGGNYDLVEEQIDLLHTYSFEREENSMNYLKELYDFLEVPEDVLFRDYSRRKREIEDQKREMVLESEKSDEKVNFIGGIGNILKTAPEYSHYREYDEEITRIEDRIVELDKKPFESGENKPALYYEATLRRVSDDTTIKKLLPAEKTYLYLKDIDGEIREDTPRYLQQEYFIVILDDDERKTFLELIIEIFDLEESVDKHLIELWREKLSEFVEECDLSYRDFYKQYKGMGGVRGYQTVLHWIKRGALGPRHSSDLYLIGKALNDDEIVDNYKIIDQEVRNLRKLHQAIGRKLRKIIKEILKGNLDPTKLNYEEYLLYESVKDGIYEVLELKRQ